MHAAKHRHVVHEANTHIWNCGIIVIDPSLPYLDDALNLEILSVLLLLHLLHLLDTGVVRLAAAAAAGAPAALPLAVFPVDASLQLEFLVEGGLALTLETEGCLNGWRGDIQTKDNKRKP